MQGSNGSGNDNGDDNVIRMPAPGKDKRIRVKITMPHSTQEKQPLINLPPFTKIMVIVFIGIQAAMSVISEPQRYDVIAHLGFIPARYTSAASFDLYTFISPLTYGFLHGGWVHLLMNIVMMMAFGAGLERWMGWRRLAVFMLVTSILSMVFYTIITPHSTEPVVGASGALSAMFAAAIIMMQQQSGFLGQGKYRYAPLIIMWIGISALFGFMGGPGGENIAWTAHIGGFLAGFIVLKPVMRLFAPGR